MPPFTPPPPTRIARWQFTYVPSRDIWEDGSTAGHLRRWIASCPSQAIVRRFTSILKGDENLQPFQSLTRYSVTQWDTSRAVPRLVGVLVFLRLIATETRDWSNRFFLYWLVDPHAEVHPWNSLFSPDFSPYLHRVFLCLADHLPFSLIQMPVPLTVLTAELPSKLPPFPGFPSEVAVSPYDEVPTGVTDPTPQTSYYIFWFNPAFASTPVPEFLKPIARKGCEVARKFSGGDLFSATDDPSAEELNRLMMGRGEMERWFAQHIPVFDRVRDRYRASLGEGDIWHVIDSNFGAFAEAGFTVTKFRTDSDAGRELVSRYRDEVIITFTDCLDSQGSSYTAVIRAQEGGAIFNPDMLTVPYLLSLLGEQTCILEYRSETGGAPRYLGLLFAHRFRSPPRYSSQLMAGAIFPKIYRGFGLGTLFAMAGITLISNTSDLVHLYTTEFNTPMHRMMARLQCEYFYNVTNEYYSNVPGHPGEITACDLNHGWYPVYKHRPQLRQLREKYLKRGLLVDRL